MSDYNFDDSVMGLLIEALRAAGYNQIATKRILMHLYTASTIIPPEQAKDALADFRKANNL